MDQKGEEHSADMAVDGLEETYWSSAFGDPQWIAVELAEEYKIRRVALDWHKGAYGKAYKVQVSLDGKTWRDVFSTDKGKGGREEITFEPAPARFVRVYGTARGTQYGYALWEMEVSE